jgi:His-Xaa-Ser system protein HxsD
VSELVVDFDRSTQSLGALREAAYRLIGVGSCRIESADEGARFICHLEVAQNPKSRRVLAPAELREHFLNLVTDENLREKVAGETNHIRDLVMALAFGAWAQGEAA